MDSFVIKAIAAELTARIHQARVEQILEIRKWVYLLSLRSRGRKAQLLLSCDPALPGVHLLEKLLETTAPSSFSRALRIHLARGIVREVHLPYLERVLILRIERRKTSGLLKRFELIVEIMAARSNIILTDADTGRILDCARHVGSDRNRFRELLPGRPYVPPPPPRKLDPQSLKAEQIPESFPSDRAAQRWLVEQVAGFSPLLAKESVHRAAGAHLSGVIGAILDTYRQERFEPALYRDPASGALTLSALPLFHLAQRERIATVGMNEAAARHREATEGGQRLSDRKKTLLQAVEKALKKTAARAEHLAQDLAATREVEAVRQEAEWLKGNIHQLKQGMHEARLMDPEAQAPNPISVKLDPTISPGENVQRAFQRYRKLQRMAVITRERLREAAEEAEYLRQVLDAVERADAPEVLDEIREELVAGRYLRKASKTKGVKRPKPAPPLCFRSCEGHTMLVGRNNRDNDRLVTRLSRGEDLWLHAHRIPGAHVIIRNPQRQAISEPVLREGALLAAYHSKGHREAQVAVDYTFRKHVRKGPGFRPGMVTFTHGKTVTVTPDEALLPKRCDS
jgi:predicted ribosome quality control (RQC) complex YloA/Tae2 family protein